MGTFKPIGFGFSGSPKAKAIIQEIAKLLEPIGATTISDGGGGTDIYPIMKSGVPGMDIRTMNQNYVSFVGKINRASFIIITLLRIRLLL
jgi:carboxypeptidase Q